MYYDITKVPTPLRRRSNLLRILPYHPFYRWTNNKYLFGNFTILSITSYYPLKSLYIPIYLSHKNNTRSKFISPPPPKRKLYPRQKLIKIKVWRMRLFFPPLADGSLECKA